ncbi:MAG: aldehyde dehydrogenase family protein [Byssovorax sp.]
MGYVMSVAGNGTSNNGQAATSIKSYAPATGELLGEAPITSAEDVKKAVARARRAQEAWGALPVAERGKRMLRFRDALVDRADEVIDLLVRECGKPRHEALLHEVMVVADLCTHFVKVAPSVLAPRSIPLHLMKHRRSMLHYAPRGVVGVISPWNYPFQLPLRDIVTALIAGNAAVLKPSEVTPLVALKAKEIWDGAGLPEDLFQVVTGFGATGAALIDAGIQFLVFTGGVATGRKVAAACGERLIPCVMELGGKAPLIACADADLERTARAIVFGGFSNCGQICIAVERVYAHREIHDKLLDRVVALTGELRQGDPAKSIVDVGAIIFPQQIEIAEKHIADAVQKGAEIKTGGKRATGPGQFFPPTVLAGCNHTMTVMKEEIFGPVVPFMKVTTEEEAVRLANESHLGLNAYVFSADREHGARIAERVQAGSVLVNDVLSNGGTVEAPFGGIKQSGFGRAMGDDALREMCDVKHISVDRVSTENDPLWFPYTEKSYAWFKKGLRAMFGGGSVLGASAICSYRERSRHPRKKRKKRRKTAKTQEEKRRPSFPSFLRLCVEIRPFEPPVASPGPPISSPPLRVARRVRVLEDHRLQVNLALYHRLPEQVGEQHRRRRREAREALDQHHAHEILGAEDLRRPTVERQVRDEREHPALGPPHQLDPLLG